MVEAILTVLSTFIQNMFMFFGPFGVGIILAMAIESACIPLPSEIIMPFAGYLVIAGGVNNAPFFNFGGTQTTIFVVGMLGAFGCLVGSIVAYAVGLYGGRPFLNKYGKYILISHHDMDLADKFFNKYGEIGIFLSRLMPVVRTFISLPAGIAKMNFWKFSFYSMLGSIPWCWALAWVGWRVGSQASDIVTYKEGLKHSLGKWLHLVDAIILLLLIAVFVWYVMRHLGLMEKQKQKGKGKKSKKRK
jgi:membrane protein DedA with SNARE-associated domain